MIKTTLAILLCLAASSGSAQWNSRFRKTIESNFVWGQMKISNGDTTDICNLECKAPAEKLLFGDVNARVEYFMAPPFDGDHGFRIVKNPAGTAYRLEIKRISNRLEVEKQVNEKFRRILSADEILSYPGSREELRKHNDSISAKQDAERKKLLKLETRSFPVSDSFADGLHAKFVSSIDGYKGKKERPEGDDLQVPSTGTYTVCRQVADGCRATFRCVVGDDVWTFTIRNPRPGEVSGLPDLCRRIMDDAIAGQFDETKYVESLMN